MESKRPNSRRGAYPRQRRSSVARILIVLGVLACAAYYVVVVVLPTNTGYRNYVVRSRFSEGIAMADGAKTAVLEYYADHERAFPSSNEEAKFTDPSGDALSPVQSVSIGAGGVVVVTFNRTVPELSGKSIILSPTASEDGIAKFTCSAGDISPEYRSKSCL